MRIIDVLQPDKKTSKWIVDNYKNELLVVDNSFQRNYVWLEKHQISLIETILLGYAIPELYLWVIDTDPITGETKYSIVDGQQRIGAVFNFIDGKFKLRRAYLSNKDADYVEKTFSDLSDDEKRLIWSYSFTIRQLPQEVSREEIVKMFLRLNSTDKSLNPQELRNAIKKSRHLPSGKCLKGAISLQLFSRWELLYPYMLCFVTHLLLTLLIKIHLFLGRQGKILLKFLTISGIIKISFQQKFHL